MTEIIFIIINRPYCIDWMIRNIEKAEKPKDIQLLLISSADKKYTDEVADKLSFIEKRRVVYTGIPSINHDQIQHDDPRKYDVKPSSQKMRNLFLVAKVIMDNCDRSADWYWMIEDDTLFPLNTYERYSTVIERTGGDLATGISYYWHNDWAAQRNFWNIEETRIFPEGDSCNDVSIKVTPMNYQPKGIVKLGATGLGNVLMRREAWLSWNPMDYLFMHGNGQDIAFYYHLMKKGYTAYGLWDLFLPHITVFPNKDIQIIGRIHESLLKNVLQ